MAKRPAKGGLPSREQLLEFIQSSDEPAGKSEIARAFRLKGNDKIALKALLRDMADEGLIDSAPGRAFHKMGGVPKVTVLRIVDVEGATPIAVPESWQAEGKRPPRAQAPRIGTRGRRPHPRTHRGGRAGLDRPPDEDARPRRGAGAGRPPPRGRP